MVFYQQTCLINNNNSASSPKKINKRLKQISSNHPNLSRNTRRARPNRKVSPESIMPHVHALLWYFIFTILPRPETDTKPFHLHPIVHTILFLYAEQHRNSKRANSVVTFRRQQCWNKEKEREGGREREDCGGQGPRRRGNVSWTRKGTRWCFTSRPSARIWRSAALILDPSA